MACTTDSLSEKEIISVCDGRRLGYACNYELDPCCGRITALYVPGEGGFLGFGQGEDVRIPWEKIEKIGEDTILVNVPPPPVCADDCTCRVQKPKNKSWFF